ncbi:hypothetical protein L1887_59571 [Cichorium endivia]|nr:hypothetical protein L1887_59571 [Cichorium endivia]
MVSTRPVSWTSPPAEAPEMRCSRMELTSEAADVRSEKKYRVDEEEWSVDSVRGEERQHGVAAAQPALTRLGGGVGMMRWTKCPSLESRQQRQLERCGDGRGRDESTVGLIGSVSTFAVFGDWLGDFCFLPAIGQDALIGCHRGPGLGSVDECNKGLPENPDDADDDDDDDDAGCVVGGVVLYIDERKAVTLALSVRGLSMLPRPRWIGARAPHLPSCVFGYVCAADDHGGTKTAIIRTTGTAADRARLAVAMRRNERASRRL